MTPYSFVRVSFWLLVGTVFAAGLALVVGPNVLSAGLRIASVAAWFVFFLWGVISPRLRTTFGGEVGLLLLTLSGFTRSVWSLVEHPESGWSWVSAIIWTALVGLYVTSTILKARNLPDGQFTPAYWNMEPPLIRS